MHSYQYDEHHQHHWYSEFSATVVEKVKRWEETMIGQKTYFLNDVVDSKLSGEERVEETEQVNETYAEDEYFRLGTADQ